MTLPANKPLRRALTNRSFFSFRHSSVNKTVQASNLSEKLSKAAVTAATTAALFASVRPFFSLFSLLFKGGFWSGFILRRGIKLSFFPRHRRRRLSLSVWQNAKRRASLRTGCDEPMRCIDTSPGRCARALRVVQRSSRVFFAFECSKKKETRRGQTLGEVIAKKGQKSYLFLVFCPKRDLKNRLKEEKKV
jgi:hypothetical protein